MKPQDIYLVRHCEPEGGRVYLGAGSDPALSREGYSQAAALAGYFAGECFDEVFTSPLRRSLETAAAIAGRKTSLTVLDDLKEMHFGRWEGMSYSDIALQDRGLLEAWTTDPRKACPPGGEPYEDFVARVKQCFGDMISRNPGKKLLVVSHGGVLRVYLSRILGIDSSRLWSFALHRGSVSLVRIHSGGLEIIEFLNCLIDPSGSHVIRSSQS